ncbi:hypothetical protein TDB9533_04219 [Thalassocella blandensis]|nr:hypothetical protein TDB9533_04219 [Thalassocella blandensis]
MIDDLDQLPDVRDGLTRRERIVLNCLSELQRELGVGAEPAEVNQVSKQATTQGFQNQEKQHLRSRSGRTQLTRKNVPTIMLYGRVIEHIDMSKDELQEILSRWCGAAGA